VRFALRAIGEILITCSVIVFGFMAYMYWGTAVREANAQRGLAGQLNRQWASPGAGLALHTGRLSLGQPFAFIVIPKFGKNWRFAVVQGTGLAQLALGPGHVPGTQLPGQRGNVAIAGHRVTAGNPFWSLPALRKGDEVLVETVAATFEYRITGRPVIVSPDDNALLAPVPGHPGVAARRRYLTLITCDPPWTGTNRVIATGVQVGKVPRPPAERS
jgi:sortase A